MSHQSDVAQDLLEALIMAEAALNNIRVCCQHTAWDETGPAIIAARAAIARALAEIDINAAERIA